MMLYYVQIATDGGEWYTIPASQNKKLSGAKHLATVMKGLLPSTTVRIVDADDNEVHV